MEEPLLVQQEFQGDTEEMEESRPEKYGRTPQNGRLGECPAPAEATHSGNSPQCCLQVLVRWKFSKLGAKTGSYKLSERKTQPNRKNKIRPCTQGQDAGCFAFGSNSFGPTQCIKQEQEYSEDASRQLSDLPYTLS